MKTNRTGHALLRIAGITPVIAALLVTFNSSAHPAALPIMTQAVQAPQSGEVVLYADMMPKFQGGTLSEFRNWIQSQIAYPEDACQNKIEGMAIVNFIIETDGSLTHIEILKSLYPSLDTEAIRILESSPKWAPGETQGQKVRIKLTLPIRFSLPK